MHPYTFHETRRYFFNRLQLGDCIDDIEKQTVLNFTKMSLGRVMSNSLGFVITRFENYKLSKISETRLVALLLVTLIHECKHSYRNGVSCLLQPWHRFTDMSIMAGACMRLFFHNVCKRLFPVAGDVVVCQPIKLLKRIETGL